MIEHVNIPEERLLKLKRVRNVESTLKEFLDVKITIGDDILIEGNSLQVLRAKEIIKAYGRGFTFNQSLDLLDDEYYLDVMNISDFIGKSKDRQVVMKGRLIGADGVTKKMIEKDCEVKLSIYGKTICIIGKPKNIKFARIAIEMILSGSKHNSVYRFLQENRVV